MTLTKIKARNGKPVVIHWIEPTGTGEIEERTLTCAEPGMPELYEAMAGLKGHVLGLCELPEAYGEGMDIIGLTIIEGEEVSVVVTALKKLNACPSPLVINSPLAVPGGHMRELAEIERQAMRYVNGLRAQIEIDFVSKEEVVQELEEEEA